MSEQAQTHSLAWQKGYEAAKQASCRKPPRGASQTWQDEYWAGWHVGKAEAEAAYQVWREHAKRLLGDEHKETTK